MAARKAPASLNGSALMPATAGTVLTASRAIAMRAQCSSCAAMERPCRSACSRNASPKACGSETWTAALAAGRDEVFCVISGTPFFDSRASRMRWRCQNVQSDFMPKLIAFGYEDSRICVFCLMDFVCLSSPPVPCAARNTKYPALTFQYPGHLRLLFPITLCSSVGSYTDNASVVRKYSTVNQIQAKTI